MNNNYLIHHGIKGQKWGVRRYQNKDGSLTKKGKKRLESVTKKHTNNMVDNPRVFDQITTNMDIYDKHVNNSQTNPYSKKQYRDAELEYKKSLKDVQRVIKEYGDKKIKDIVSESGIDTEASRRYVQQLVRNRAKSLSSHMLGDFYLNVASKE